MLSRPCLPLLLVALTSCAGLSGMEQKPVPIHNAKPKYPPVAELHGRSGTVVLDCTITKEGDAKACAATNGDHDFVAAALAFMQSARYKPSLRDGVPIAYTHYTIRIAFEAKAPRPITIPAHCAVAASGIIRTCRADATNPPYTWPIAKAMAEGTRIAPESVGSQAVEDPARALSLVFAYVDLPWYGPEPNVEGEIGISELLACERHFVTTSAVSLACKMAGPADSLADTDATEHLRAYLAIKNAVPPEAGDFSDPS